METFVAQRANDDGGIEMLAAIAAPDQSSFVANLVPFWTLSDRGTYFVPGSGKKTAKEAGANAPHLYQHDPWQMIGKHSWAEERDDGLYIGVDVNEEVPGGAQVMSNLRFGVPSGVSAGIDRLGQRPGTKADDAKLRRETAPAFVQMMAIEDLVAITEYKLWESSTVTWGALATAKVTEVNAASSTADLIQALTCRALAPAELQQVQAFVDSQAALAAAATEHSTEAPGGDTAPDDDEQALLMLAAYRGIRAREISQR